MTYIQPREFYTVEENEQFYIQAANRFLRIHKQHSRDTIFNGAQLRKAHFFKLYYQTYRWAKGVWHTKNEAKRMYDGIQRYFINRFDSMIRSEIAKNVSAADMIQKVKVEAIEVFNQSTYDRMMVKWENLAYQLEAQKKLVSAPLEGFKFISTKDYDLENQIQTQQCTPLNVSNAANWSIMPPNLSPHFTLCGNSSKTMENNRQQPSIDDCDIDAIITKLQMILRSDQ